MYTQLVDFPKLITPINYSNNIKKICNDSDYTTANKICKDQLQNLLKKVIQIIEKK